MGKQAAYVAAYFSYLDFMGELSDAECGRLFKAMLIYGSTGTAPELSGNERYVFPGIKSQIDRDAEKYQDRCRKNQESANVRWNANGCERMRTHTDQSKRSKPDAKHAKEKEKEKEKEKDTPIPPTPLPGVGPELAQVFGEWLAYKHERREDYRPTGLKNLTAQVKANADKYGEGAVCALIRECMASNWKGIIFERLENRSARPARQNGPGEDYHASPERIQKNADWLDEFLAGYGGETAEERSSEHERGTV